jgi:23S rRNA (adenine2503-C2)-methyltransferase
MFALTQTSLKQILKDKGYRDSYRSKQIIHNLYSNGIMDFSSMLQLPQDLRQQLAEEFTFGDLETVLEQISKDGTIKRAYRLTGGQVIESVLMPYRDGRYTACVSSQAGCGMGCVFCATGQMGFGRQLSDTEIFEQAAKYACELRAKGLRLSNVVMMGMVWDVVALSPFCLYIC